MNIKIGRGNLATTSTDQQIKAVKNFTKKPKINNIDLEFFPLESTPTLTRYSGSASPRISNGSLAGSAVSCVVQNIQLAPIFIPRPMSITGISFRTSGSNFWPNALAALPYSIFLYNSHSQDYLPSSLISTLVPSTVIPLNTSQNTWINNTFSAISLNRGLYWIGFLAGAANNMSSGSIELAGVANTNSLPNFESIMLTKLIGLGSNQTSQCFGLAIAVDVDYNIPTSLNTNTLDLQFITANQSSFKLRANQPVFWLTYS